MAVVDLSVLEAVGLCADTFAQAAIPVVFHVEEPGPSPLLVRAGERLDGLGVAIDSLVRFGVRERLATDDILGPGCTPSPAAARTLALAVVSDFHLVWPNLAA